MMSRHSDNAFMTADVPGEDDTEEKDLESPEQLRREAVPHQHQPELLLPFSLQQLSGKQELGRAPAMDWLSELVGCEKGDRATDMTVTGREDCRTSNAVTGEEEGVVVKDDKSTKMRKVMTSTMIGEDEQEIIMKDISVIHTRKSIDPRLSKVLTETVTEGLGDQEQHASSLSISPSSILTVLSSETIEVTESEVESVPSLPLICQYPPKPHAGSICVRLPDFLTLAEGTFLNDIIIDFYLSYLFGEKLNKSRRDNIHIFSSHFFKRLSVDPVEGSMMANLEKMSILSLVQIRHMRVQNWTKSTNLAEKKLVIFPICKNSHWFLVLAVLTTKKYLLVVMDSLGGDNKEDVNLIKEYLIIELNTQRQNKNLQPESMRVVRPSLPQQDNFTDCGVFLLHYVEKILERPELFFSFEDEDLSNLFTKSEVDRKRSSVARLIRQLSEEQTLSGEAADLPYLFGEDAEEIVNAGDVLRQLIQSELDKLSPLTSSSGEYVNIESAVVVPSPASTRVPPVSKKFRLANPKTIPQLSLYTQTEYYRGKPSSERMFDDLLEEEEGRDNTRWKVKLGRKKYQLPVGSNVL